MELRAHQPGGATATGHERLGEDAATAVLSRARTFMDWNDVARPYSHVENSRRAIVFPFIRERLKESSPGTLLDFGCGDGAVARSRRETRSALLTRCGASSSLPVHFVTHGSAALTLYFSGIGGLPWSGKQISAKGKHGRAE